MWHSLVDALGCSRAGVLFSPAWQSCFAPAVGRHFNLRTLAGRTRRRYVGQCKSGPAGHQSAVAASRRPLCPPTEHFISIAARFIIRQSLPSMTLRLSIGKLAGAASLRTAGRLQF